MRAHRLVAFSMLIYLGLVSAALCAEHSWDVYSSSDLDPRIERQLNLLAAQDQALVRIVKGSPGRGQSVPVGGLVIELRQQETGDAVLEFLKSEAGSTPIFPSSDAAKEAYVMEVNYPRASVPNRLRITAATAQGFHLALLRVPDLLALPPSSLADGLVPHPQVVRVERNGMAAVVADFPSFPERGVVEGFYGPPWSHQARIDMLRFEGGHGMNTFYYAPKDDPYHRKLWREAYPPETLQQLGGLVDAAHRNFVDFCFAISPGLSMTYSSERDFQDLTNKLASVGKLGVSCFALFLDDVPPELQNPQDRAKFKDLAQAHVFLTNKLYTWLKQQSAANRLVLTPTTYTNEFGSRDYVRELGAGVDPGVSIVWTGPKVLSAAITADQAREWGGYLHRPPLIWDNYPVNDEAPWCRYLGPLTGRDAHLPEVARGFFSNPMIEAHASMLALETIADYLWNAAAYDPAKSETHAEVTLYGEDAPRLLAPLLKTYGAYNWQDGLFMPLFKERRYPFDVDKMQSTLTELDGALERLRNQRRFEPLLKDVAPALEQTKARLPEVKADSAFQHLPDGKLQWNQNSEALSAYRLSHSPNLDGDFAKWKNGPVYRVDEPAQVTTGEKRWNGPHSLSARVAIAWDASFLYVGVDVTDPDLYQPFYARGIQNADTFALDVEAGFRKNLLATEPTGDEYMLYFSPGDFGVVKPSIFSDEDYLPPRAQPHNYMQEIFTAWKKTASGYSGDIAIPVTFFEGGAFAPGYEMGLVFSARKVVRPSGSTDADRLERIVLQSKRDHLFRTSNINPSSFPRLVLTEAKP